MTKTYCVMKHTGGSYWKVVWMELVDEKGKITSRKSTNDHFAACVNKCCLELENPGVKYAVMQM